LPFLAGKTGEGLQATDSQAIRLPAAKFDRFTPARTAKRQNF